MVSKLCAWVPYIDLSFISLVSNFLFPFSIRGFSGLKRGKVGIFPSFLVKWLC